jgi:hypothetical protein
VGKESYGGFQKFDKNRNRNIYMSLCTYAEYVEALVPLKNCLVRRVDGGGRKRGIVEEDKR